MQIDLAIIGAQKAGTTALFNYLKQHPGLRGHAQREFTFFYYDAEFAQGESQALARYFPDHDREPDAGSAHVIKHVFLMRSATAVERLRQHNPDCRLACVLRDPVKRAWSAYLHARRRGWQDARVPFAEIVRQQIEAHAADAGHDDPRLDYVRNGCYLDDLQRVAAIFPRRALHVVLAEDLAGDPAGETNRLLAQAGYAPLPASFTAERHNVQKRARSERLARAVSRLERSRLLRGAASLIPAGAKHRLRYALIALNERRAAPQPMDPAALDLLARFYAPRNRALAAWLGTELRWTTPGAEP